MYYEKGNIIWFKKYRNYNPKKTNILFLIYEEIEEINLNFSIEFDIEIQTVVKFPDKQYENNKFKYKEIYFIYNFDI